MWSFSFENYLGKNGISTHSTTDKNELISNIQSGRPTILLGQNTNGRANTPYGTSSSHYVLATGVDGKGNVVIQDPESRKPNSVYPMTDVINNSHLGMVTGKLTGKGRKSGRFSSIKNKITASINGRGKTKSEIEKTVWSQLRGAGFSELQVAAIMGNIKHESGFKPDAIEKGVTNGGYGLCQWTDPSNGKGRRTQLQKYASSVGKKASDLNVQIAFLIAELTPGGGANGYASYQFNKSSTRYDGKTYTRNTFDTTKDIEVATRAFCFCFERPSYSASVNHISSRIKSAKSYYEQYTGTAASSTDLTDSNTSTESATTSTLFSALSTEALSYFDEGLLSLFGFTNDDTTEGEADDGSSDGYNGTVSGDAASVLQVAQAEVGTKESPMGSNKQKYGKEYGLNGQPWCGIFVWWVFKHAGCLDLIKSCPNIAYVPTIYSHFKKKGWIVSKTKGKPGDIFISGGQAHTGIIKENLGNGKYKTIEGNCGDAVKSITRSDITYIVSVKYGTNSGEGSAKQKIANHYNNLSSKNKSYNNRIAAISSGKGTTRSKNTTTTLLNKEFNSRSYSGTGTGSGIGSLKMYNNYRKSLSGRGSTSTLPSLSTIKSGYTSTNVSNSYTNTGSSVSMTGNSSTDKLLSVIIDVLSIIANNSEKLSQIVELLSKALDLNLTDNDISKLSSNNAQIKNKLANALKSQGSSTGMGNSIMNASTESLATAMYSIASA